MRRFNLAAWRTFCEVAETSSYSVAAKRLFRTQPALSKQISDLEAHLGVKLFERRGRTVGLTLVGAQLHRHARQLLEDAASLEARAQALARGDQGALRIGAHTLLFRQALPDLLWAFTRSWNSIDVTLFEDSAERLATRVESRDLDFAFARYMTSDMLVAKRLFPMHVIAAVSRSHRFARRRSVEVHELREENLLLMPENSGSRLLLEQACQAEGVRLSNVKMEATSPEGLVGLAAAGQGVAVLFTMSAIDNPRVRVVPVVHRKQQLAMWSAIIWARHRVLPPYAQGLIEIASQRMQRSFPGQVYGYKASAT